MHGYFFCISGIYFQLHLPAIYRGCQNNMGLMNIGCENVAFTIHGRFKQCRRQFLVWLFDFGILTNDHWTNINICQFQIFKLKNSVSLSWLYAYKIRTTAYTKGRSNWIYVKWANAKTGTDAKSHIDVDRETRRDIDWTMGICIFKMAWDKKKTLIDKHNQYTHQTRIHGIRFRSSFHEFCLKFHVCLILYWKAQNRHASS